ncbi:MAG: Kelch repeat-containing protein [Gemmatimonadaceae bacterium]
MTSITIPRLGALALVGVLIQPASAPTKSAESIEQVATLHTARAAHTATTLPSGHVLVVGGMATGGRSLAAVELFDPTRNTTQELGSVAEPRAGHTATLLGDGRVLIAGGYNGEYLQSVEISDASARRFRPAGSLVEARSGHTATLLPGGRVLFVGGVGQGWTFLRSAELYDPATGRSEAVGPMSVPRESHTATLLDDGRVVVIGGHSGRRQAMEVYASAEAWVPRTRRFEAAGTLATARHKHDAIKLADGRVLVIGGADRSDRVHYATTEIYSSGTAAFERGPSMVNRRYKIAGTSVLLPSGEVLITSGARAAELLDLGAGVFREVPGRFPEAYRFAAAAPLRGGDVFIAGGYSDGNQNTAGVWRFRRLPRNER